MRGKGEMVCSRASEVLAAFLGLFKGVQELGETCPEIQLLNQRRDQRSQIFLRVRNEE